jgi:hypothetical protein
MANRYRVNGSTTGYWSDTQGWSTTSGGAGGASVPVVGDTAIFDGNSPYTSVDSASVTVSAIQTTAAFSTVLTGNPIVVVGTGSAVTLNCAVGATIDTNFYISTTSGSVAVNVNYTNNNSFAYNYFYFGSSGGTATYTITTNGNFVGVYGFCGNLVVNGGTLSCGTVNTTITSLQVNGGSFTAGGTTITSSGAVEFYGPGTTSLGTSTINASQIFLYSNSVVTVGATQTLSASIGINILTATAGTTTLRTLNAPDFSIQLGSGVNLVVGAITSTNGSNSLTVTTQGTITVLPTFTATSITVNTIYSYYVWINGPGFTCGAISLTSTATSPVNLYYVDNSQGTVNVTGAITLVDTNLYAQILGIYLNSAPAFSGTPTVTYAALNASVRGFISVGNNRAVSATTVTAGQIYSDGFYPPTANVTFGAMTLGGTLSSVAYTGTVLYGASVPLTFSATSITPGTGADLNISFTGVETISISGAVTCNTILIEDTVNLPSAGVGNVTIGGTLSVTNSNPTYAAEIPTIRNKVAVSLAAITITGTAIPNNTALRLGDFISSKPIGNLTVSGALTIGSSASTRSGVSIFSSGTVNFSSTTATHAVAFFEVKDTGFGGLSFGAGSTLALNYNALNTILTYPLFINTTAGSIVTLRTVTCDYLQANTVFGQFYINAPIGVVTFGSSPTVGATAGKLSFYVNALSLSCPALSVDSYTVVLTGALTQSGAITIPTPSPATSYNIVNITVGATSTINSIVCSAITDTANTYTISLNGTGAISCGAITGPTVTVTTDLALTNSVSTTFTGAISSITNFKHFTGNLIFTGSIAIGLTRSMLLKPGYTVTPNTSVITIAGTYENKSYLDHGGYTLYSVIFSACPEQYIYNSSNTTGLTLTNLSCTGAASPTSFLQLGTDVTVTGATASLKLTLAPNSIVNRLLVTSSVIGVARTLSAGSVRTISTGIDFCDITAANATPWNLSAISAGDAEGNTGITFTTAVSRYAVTAGGNWDATSTWSATVSPLTGGATAPLAQDTVYLSTAGTAALNTNNRRFLGKVDFSGYTGGLTVSGISYSLDSMDLTSVGAIYNVINFDTLGMLTRSTATFTPPSGMQNVSLSIVGLGTVNITGPNDISSQGRVLISGYTLSTNTGTRICNISANSSVVVGMTNTNLLAAGDNALNGNAALSAVNLTSSTVTSDVIIYEGSVAATTHSSTSTSSTIFDGTISFTNSTITSSGTFATGISANVSLGTSSVTANNVTLNLGTWNGQSEVVTSRTNFTIQSGLTYTPGSDTFRIQPTGSSVSFTLTCAPTAAYINKFVFDDSLSIADANQSLELYTDFLGGTVYIKQFDSSLLSRPMHCVVTSMRFNVEGGLSSKFSNKAWTFFRNTEFRISGSDPLYIPFAFLQNTTVVSGDVVAYGPANLGANTGNISYPSNLRYYAFVGTGATSMVVPNDYNGMGLFVAVGGGATAASSTLTATRGGGSGSTSYSFAYPINNTAQPLLPGQTIYLNAGAYATAPVAGGSGSNGNQSWINALFNGAPVFSYEGARALGGQASGAGGSLGVGRYIFSGKSSGTVVSAPSAGSGGASTLFGTTNVTGTTSGGGAGISSTNSGSTGGSGSVAGGAGGTTGAPSTGGADGASSTGAGGGGGGSNNGTSSTPNATTTRTDSTRSGSTALVITLPSHGFSTGSTITITAASLLRSGSYSRNSTTNIVTWNVSTTGLVTGDSVYFAPTSGSVSAGTKVVTVVSPTQLQFSSTTGTTGNANIGQTGVTLTTYTVTYLTTNTFSITGSVSTILRSGDLSLTFTYSARNASRGGSGALNSAQQFIRYYNGVYTPGYFGIGAGGGGGGCVITASNTTGQAGSGGDGGIGSGGGGKGSPGISVTTGIATGGRGGPGLVMFVYALRSNNQAAIQGL